jgi:catalase
MKTERDMHKYGSASVRRLALAALAALAVASLGGPAWGHIPVEMKNGPSESLDTVGGPALNASAYLAQKKGQPKPYLDNYPPEERPRMQQQFREWQSLPPDQKDAMRRRMDEWNRMPPNEQDRYQQRYRQWQQLSPDERRQLENNLRRWDNLSPQDRDSIRQRFRK